MQKIICSSILIMLLAGLGLIIGCASGGNKEAGQQPGQYKTYFTVNDGPTQDDTRRQLEWAASIKRFNAIYPDIEVRPDPWKYEPQSFITKMAGGTAPDCIGLFATEGPIVIDKGLALDITDMFNTWEGKSGINPKALEPFMRNGRIYGVPHNGYVLGLLYNKRLFKDAGIVDEKGEPKPPMTWDEFVTTAKKLTDRKKNQAGFGILGGDKESGWHLLNWVWQAGGDFEVQRDGKWVAVFDGPEAVRALQFVKDLRWKHDVLQTNVLTKVKEIFQLFASDRIAMAIIGPGWIDDLCYDYGVKIEDVGLSILPAGPAGHANQMGGNYLMVNPQAPKERQEVAFKWITFAMSLSEREHNLQAKIEQKRLVGIPEFPIFIGETQKKYDEIVNKYRNVPKFPIFEENAGKYVRAEPPIQCQTLYAEALTPPMQEVLTNKNADPAALLKKSVAQFQKNVLDPFNQGQ